MHTENKRQLAEAPAVSGGVGDVSGEGGNTIASSGAGDILKGVPAQAGTPGRKVRQVCFDVYD